MNKYILRSVLILLLFSDNVFPQFNEQTGKSEWQVEDTVVSAPFIRAYKEQLVKVKGDIGAEEDPSSKALSEDRMIVEVGLDGKTPVLRSVKTIDIDRAITQLDIRVISTMRPAEIQRLIQRQYKWDEVNKSLIKNYSTDILTIFDLRNNKESRDIFWWSSSATQIVLPTSWLVRLDERLGAEVSLSNEEYGYPNGLIGGGPGIVKIGLSHQVAKVYFTIPAKIGKNNLEGAYGIGLSFDDVNLGGGFMLQDIESFGVRDFKEIHRSSPNEYSSVFLKYGGYAYYSLTHDVGKIVPNSTLRWKVGPALLTYGRGTIVNGTNDWNFVYTPEFSFYGRFEFVNGNSLNNSFRTLEFALQGIVGNHRHLMVSATYNIESWFGIECTIASVTPSDSWRRPFTFIIQPKFRL